MKHINIQNKSYLMHEDNDGEFYLIPCVALNNAWTFDETLKDKAIAKYYADDTEESDDMEERLEACGFEKVLSPEQLVKLNRIEKNERYRIAFHLNGHNWGDTQPYMWNGTNLAEGQALCENAKIARHEKMIKLAGIS